MCPAHLEHHGFDSRRGLMRAVSWSVRPIIQAFQSVAFVGREPAVHRPPRDAPIPGHLVHRPTVADYRQDRLVTLLSHAHLPHARERDKSAEADVTHQQKDFWDLSAELVQHDGARAGSRTLNLWIKRLWTDRLRTSQRGLRRLTSIRAYDAIVSGRLRECHGVSWLSCQTSCQIIVCGGPSRW